MFLHPNRQFATKTNVLTWYFYIAILLEDIKGCVTLQTQRCAKERKNLTMINKRKDWEPRTPLQTRCELECSRRIHSYCYIHCTWIIINKHTFTINLLKCDLNIVKLNTNIVSTFCWMIGWSGALMSAVVISTLCNGRRCFVLKYDFRIISERKWKEYSKHC